MGPSVDRCRLNRTKPRHKMKAFIASAIALAAGASAEADPALLYNGLGYTGLGYAGLGYRAGLLAAPYTTAAVAAPVIAAPAVYNTGTKAGNLNLFGGIHSSNLGVCLNNEGVQVPC